LIVKNEKEDIMNLKEKRKNIKKAIEHKVNEYNQLENLKQKLKEEILQLQGQLKLINELLKDKGVKDENNKTN